MLQLIVPLVVLTLGSGILGLWFIDRTHKYILLIAVGFLMMGTALMFQVTLIPGDLGINTILAAMGYVGGALLFASGILLRSGYKLSPVLAVVAFTVIVSLMWYHFYIENNLFKRIFIINFGLGIIFLGTTLCFRKIRSERGIDTLLYWVLIPFSLQFFIRTLLTAEVFGSREIMAESAFWNWLLFSSSIFATVIGVVLLVAITIDAVLTLKQERDTDLLTGMINRRGLNEYLEQDGGRSGDGTACVALCDIDYFKAINDSHGHSVGDAALKHIAHVLKSELRSGDVVARIGGEEFVLIFRDRGLVSSFNRLDRMRETIAKNYFLAKSTKYQTTCSFGVVVWKEGEPFWDAVDCADKSLYAAKHGGRNRVVMERVVIPPDSLRQTVSVP